MASRAVHAICISCASLLAGCIEPDPSYCDPRKPCAAGKRCNTATHTCEPAPPDAAPSDALRDAGLADRPLLTESGKVMLGGPCGTEDSVCDSELCVDGVCCEARCDGACRSCALPGKLGLCALAGSGADPRGSCGSGACAGTCDGKGSCTAFPDITTPCGSPSCASGKLTQSYCDGKGACTPRTTDCEAGHYCDGVSCKPKKSNGVACAGPEECTSGICTSTEKVCCDAACAGECETCAGKTTCSPRPASTPCGTKQPYCDDTPTTSAVKAQRCDAAKSCAVVTVTACDPYRCVTSGGTPACSTSCASHAGCTTGLCDLLDAKNTCPASSGLCYADQKACPGVGAGTQASPHCKIQSCLDALKPYVAIADGTYYENLALKAAAHLVSTGTTGPLHAGGLPQANVAKVQLRPGAASTPGIDLASFAAQIHGLDVRHASTGSGALLFARPGSSLALQTSHLAECKGIADAAIFVQNASATLTDVAIDGCPTGVKSEGVGARSLTKTSIGAFCGTGIYQDGGSLKLRDVLIAWNTGDAVFAYKVALDIDRARIGANTGWGMSLQNNSSGLITNTQVNDNGKGGIYLYFNSSALELHNMTIANNSGKEMQCDTHASGVNAIVTNSILWDKNDSSNSWSDKCTFNHSDVRATSGTAPGTGNVSVDPQFDSANTAHPYSIVGTSPCVDAGTDSGLPPFTLDLAGNPRSVDKIPGGAKIDQGAFEVQ